MMSQTFKKQLVLSAAGVCGIVLFIFMTDPRSISAGLLLVLPALVACTSFILVKLSLGIFTSLSAARIKALSLIAACGTSLVVVLGSLGQLGLQDFTLACLLIGGLSWYVRRMRTVRA